MRLAFLKKIRVVLSLIFLLAVSFLFVDFRSLIPTEYFDSILYLQFIPSLINFFNGLTIATAGFIFIIILTLIFGRVYCSTICPLGTLQDIFSNLYRRYKKKKYYRQLKPYNWIKYSFLVLVILIFFSGSLIGIYLLDPFSNFGRIISAFVKPLIITINNTAAFTLENFDIYFLYPLEIKGFTLLKIIFPLFILLLILIMSIRSGRLFCNTVCPVGTLLGLMSKVSFFRIKIAEDKCKGCQLCERVCKAGCIDRKNKSVDFSRCVSCYNCLAVCPSGGIGFENYFNNKKEIKETDYNKREFIQKVSIYFLGLTGISLSQVKIIPKKESTIPVYKKYPVTPPGSKSIEHFTNRCIACHLCVSACPTQVLQPSFLELGFTGMLQPMMEYKTSFCNFECTICTEVCPTGAIENILPEKKKLTQLGKAKFVKENCIVYTENTICGACSEHCPTKAVSMVPYEPPLVPPLIKGGNRGVELKNLNIPEVKEEYCIGCGACEFACPTKPYKSIYVEGNPVHKVAKKPEEKELEKEIDYKEDFPF
jgi:ferredoxin